MQAARKVIAVLTVVVGIVVILMGASLLKDTADHSVGTGSTIIHAGSHPVEYGSFGADFYTYIYQAVYKIANGIDDLQEGVESMVRVQNDVRKEVAGNTRAVDDLINMSARIGGYIVIAIGLAIVLYGLQCVLSAFSCVPAAVQQPVLQEPAEEHKPEEEQPEADSSEETEAAEV